MKNFFIIITFCAGLFLSTFCVGQNNCWSANTFKLTTDITSLEDMTGANVVTFPVASPRATDTISFPQDFKFHFGIIEYGQFSLSTYGWVKLGSKISQSFFSSEDDIIVPYSDQVSAFACSYKMTGVAPARKFVVQWSGTAFGGSQPVKFQLWLYELSGKIEFVHQSLNAFAGAGSYSAFCRTKVLGSNAFASIDVQTIPLPPVVNYSTVVSNNEGIPANTRYSFQPEVSKPATPEIQFSNILPGCFSVDVKDMSVNESIFYLEKKVTPGNYIFSQSSFSTTTLTTGALYSHNETAAKADSLYTFRAYACNGFVMSDTVVVSMHTPLPLLSGTRTVPGDYPTINALLADAECKHMGPDLIIELQPGYSFASEGGVVRFKPVHWNKTINSITIRPAASATSLVLTNASFNTMFIIDSVPNVHFDGRAGGIGTTNNLTITQTNVSKPAIAFIRQANGAGLYYLNIDGKIQTLQYGILYFGSNDPDLFLSYGNFPISGASINNCKFGPSSGFNYRGIVIEGGDNNIIRENEFFRFLNEAIYYSGGGINSRITRNRFYQPDLVPSSGASGYGAIVLTNMGNNMTVDSNKIGGSAAAWGAGSWKQSLNRAYSMVFFDRNTSTPIGQHVNIRNNEFGNINVTGSYPLCQVNAKGNSVISNNKIGTTDSLNSIVSVYYQIGIQPNLGTTAEVSNNFISGLKGSGEGYLINCNNLDSLRIENNNVGGADNYYSNNFTNRVSGIELSAVKYAVIKHNEVHGISSATHSALGIIEEWNAYTNTEKYAVVDSNNIHHLDARRTILGIFMRLNTVKSNSISYNRIYALNGRGPSTFTGADNPTKIFGIDMEAYEFTSNIPSRDTGYVTVSNNNIYGLDYISPSYSYEYPMTGIRSQGLNFHINNNMISLGTNTKGEASDSIELVCNGIDVYAASKAFVEHNSIYIGGKSKSVNYGIKLEPRNYSNGRKDIFLSNNLIQIDRVNTISFNDNKYYVSSINSTNSAVVANKNIWYSAADPNINTKLATWRSNCQCDSLSFIAEPKFINPSGDSLSLNLHLQAINSADSAGTPAIIPVNTDIDNDIRNNYSPIDIGADAVTPCNPTGNTSINISPSQQTIELCPAGTLTLTATLNGNITGLQWQKNLNDIPGANGLNYLVTSPGSYRLVGRTACGRIASTSVFIMQQVTQPFINLLTISPSPYCDSTTVEMQIEHNHFTLTTLQYKWYRNNVLIPGKITDHEMIEAIRNGDRITTEVINITGCGTTTVSDYVDFATSSSTWPKINIISYKDSLYSLTNKDTLKYQITNAGFGNREVIYTTAVSAPFHQFVSDSLLIFTNIPYTIKFRINISYAGQCYFSDTTQEQTIYVSNSITPRTYTFTGSGNWNDPSNWMNNEIPPSPLPFNGTIIIQPVSGPCILNVPYTVGIGGHISVMSGANFIIQGNLFLQP